MAISGSLQASSGNLRLIESIAASAPKRVDVRISDHLRALPLFNPDLEADPAPVAVVAWRQALAECDAILIASPEYGHSLPGALKNGIDWVIGSGELNQKAVAITAAVGHPERGRLGLRALRGTLQAIDAVIVWDEPIVLGTEADERGGALLECLIGAVKQA